VNGKVKDTATKAFKKQPATQTQHNNLNTQIKMGFRRERRHTILYASGDKSSESMDLLAEKLLDYALPPAKENRSLQTAPAAVTPQKQEQQETRASGTRRNTVSSQSMQDGWVHFEWPTGDKYDGNLKNKKKHGFGIMKWSNGDEYQGIWNNDKRDDIRGRYGYHHGVVYEGGFQSDRRHGEGILTWPNGDKFVGTWVKGGRCGKGTFISANGFEIEQEWNESPNINYSEFIPDKHPQGCLLPKQLL